MHRRIDPNARREHIADGLIDEIAGPEIRSIQSQLDHRAHRPTQGSRRHHFVDAAEEIVR